MKFLTRAAGVTKFARSYQYSERRVFYSNAYLKLLALKTNFHHQRLIQYQNETFQF